jgi:hypothetical protein
MKGSNSYLYKTYSKRAIAIQKDIENDLSNQSVSDNRKDHYITFDEIVQRRDNLKLEFEAEPTNYKKHLKYLLLCLYTYQCPIRKEYKNMMIVDIIPNKNDNFILRQNNGFSVVIQHDKVIRSHEAAEFKLSDALSHIIIDSLNRFPRKYILSLLTDPNKPLGAQNFDHLLHECFNGKRVGVDILRSAYITLKFSDHNFTMKQKQELAKFMRTSVQMCQNTYHKIQGISDIDHYVNKLTMDPALRDKLKNAFLKIIDEILGNEDQ